MRIKWPFALTSFFSARRESSTIRNCDPLCGNTCSRSTSCIFEDDVHPTAPHSCTPLPFPLSLSLATIASGLVISASTPWIMLLGFSTCLHCSICLFVDMVTLKSYQINTFYKYRKRNMPVFSTVYK